MAFNIIQLAIILISAFGFYLPFMYEVLAGVSLWITGSFFYACLLMFMGVIQVDMISSKEDIQENWVVWFLNLTSTVTLIYASGYSILGWFILSTNIFGFFTSAAATLLYLGYLEIKKD